MTWSTEDRREAGEAAGDVFTTHEDDATWDGPLERGEAVVWHWRGFLDGAEWQKARGGHALDMEDGRQIQYLADVILTTPDEYNADTIRWFLSELLIRLEPEVQS